LHVINPVKNIVGYAALIYNFSTNLIDVEAAAATKQTLG